MTNRITRAIHKFRSHLNWLRWTGRVPLETDLLGRLYLLAIAGAAVLFAGIQAGAREGDCVRCDLTAADMDTKCHTLYPAEAIFCVNDVAAFISYLEDEGRICRFFESTPQEEGSDVAKVLSALSFEAKARPEAEAVEIAYQALVEDYPCD